MDFFFCLLSAAFGVALSCVAIVFATLHGMLFTFLVAGFLVVAHVYSVIFARRQVAHGNKSAAAFALISPTFVALALALVLHLLFTFAARFR